MLDQQSIRKITDLSDAVAHLPLELTALRHFALKEISQLLRARVSHFVVGNVIRSGKIFNCAVSAGLTRDDERALFQQKLAGVGEESPVIDAFRKMEFKPGSASRRQLVPDRVWYNSEHFNTYNTGLKVDDTIYAWECDYRSRNFHLIFAHRPMKDIPFSTSDEMALQLFYCLTSRHLYPPEPNDLPSMLGRLSVELRRTARMMLSPLSEKQIARQLQINRHTLHYRVKRLYQIFNVTSRVELLAHWGGMRLGDDVPPGEENQVFSWNESVAACRQG